MVYYKNPLAFKIIVMYTKSYTRMRKVYEQDSFVLSGKLILVKL